MPNLTSNQSTTANGQHCALCALAAGHRPLRRAAWLLISLIYLSPANEGRQTRWERKVRGSSLTSPVITHSRLLSSPQTLLSNRTGHGQLWHMPEQRMHYLQVSGHSSSKTRWSKCASSFLLEGKWTGGKSAVESGGRSRGCKTNVDAVNEHMGTCDIYTPCPVSESIHLCQLLHCLFTTHHLPEGCVAGVGLAGFRDKGHKIAKEREYIEWVSTGLQKVKLITIKTSRNIILCAVAKPTEPLHTLKFSLIYLTTSTDVSPKSLIYQSAQLFLYEGVCVSLSY